MRKINTPLQPQIFPDGVAEIYQVENVADSGDKPRYATHLIFRLPYEAKTLGDLRYYAAMQADSSISCVIRVPRVRGIQPAGDVCILNGDTRRQYKIGRVSDNALTQPESMDLNLEVSKTSYELRREEWLEG